MPYADMSVQKKYCRVRARNRTAFLQNLKNKPCSDCGGNFPPVCMDWDHRPGEEKSARSVSAMRSWSFERYYAEIKKCDLVCANCHRIRTANRIIPI